MQDRIILHCDLDNFFASVESVFHPELKDVPMAVCGSESDRHGIVLAKNQLAKRAGIKTAQTVWQARRLCPQLVCVPPHMSLYREFSAKAQAIYLEYTDLVEPFSIDECWLDVTGSTKLFGDGAQIAGSIRRSMKERLGISVSVGVSFNKLFAKLASDVNKPDGTFEIYRCDFEEKLYGRPVSELMGVGENTSRKLSGAGIFTIGDLARAPEETLKIMLGKNGESLHRAALGLDNERVCRYDEQARPKSVGRSTTLREDISGAAAIRSVLAPLADDVSSTLRRERLLACSVQVQLKDNLFRVRQYQKQLPRPTRIADKLLGAGMELIEEGASLQNPVRLVGITAGELIDEDSGIQLSLTEDEERERRMEELGGRLDGLREKYGKNVIKRASDVRGKKK